jgi:hypothetical protein
MLLWVQANWIKKTTWGQAIDIKSLQNRLLKVCNVPTTSAGLNRLPFLMRPLTVVMKQTRQAVPTVKQTYYLDVYGQANSNGMPPDQKVNKAEELTYLYKHFKVCARFSTVM